MQRFSNMVENNPSSLYTRSCYARRIHICRKLGRVFMAEHCTDKTNHVHSSCWNKQSPEHVQRKLAIYRSRSNNFNHPYSRLFLITSKIFHQRTGAGSTKRLIIYPRFRFHVLYFQAVFGYTLLHAPE